MAGWNPPDAGNSLMDVRTSGGGRPNNDGRYVRGMTAGTSGQEPGFGTSAIDFINSRQPSSKPFVLFVALVNPHDIGFFPTGWEAAGYELERFAHLGIDLPANANDSLECKPAVQGVWRSKYDGFAPLTTAAARSHYVKARDRASYEFALASAAVALEIKDGAIRSARVALGGVATKPWRSAEAEKALVGKKAEGATFQAAAGAALEGARPYKYNAFKVELARRVIVRALETAAAMP